MNAVTEAETREITYIAAVAEATDAILEEQETAFIAGEGRCGSGRCIWILSRVAR